MNVIVTLQTHQNKEHKKLWKRTEMSSHLAHLGQRQSHSDIHAIVISAAANISGHPQKRPLPLPLSSFMDTFMEVP